MIYTGNGVGGETFKTYGCFTRSTGASFSQICLSWIEEVEIGYPSSRFYVLRFRGRAM